MRTARSLIALLAVAAPLLAGGCVRARPYEREVLSLRPMSADGERVEDRFRQHWQESREGGAGGYCHPGGGCGCN
jgi:hypothetical protein